MAATFSSIRPLLVLKSQKSESRSSHQSNINLTRLSVFPSTLHLSVPYLRSTNSRSLHRSPVVASAQSNLFKVFQTALRIGKDGIEAGTTLVPDSVPRPVARISVAVVAVTVGLFLLKSFISTAFFVLAMMGFIYFVFIAINKDEGPGPGGGSSSPATDEETTLEEARRIMEKYK